MYQDVPWWNWLQHSLRLKWYICLLFIFLSNCIKDLTMRVTDANQSYLIFVAILCRIFLPVHFVHCETRMRRKKSLPILFPLLLCFFLWHLLNILLCLWLFPSHPNTNRAISLALSYHQWKHSSQQLSLSARAEYENRISPPCTISLPEGGRGVVQQANSQEKLTFKYLQKTKFHTSFYHITYVMYTCFLGNIT